MAVEGERAAGQPWCDVCLDLSQNVRIKTSIQRLKSSGKQGCVICSFIHAGVKKMEDTKNLHRQPHLRQLRSRSSSQTQASDDDHSWTECLIEETNDSNNPSTLQVVARGRSGRQHYLEFYTDSDHHPLFPRILHRRHVDPKLDIEKAIGFIQSRLAECEVNHTCAPSKPSPLPRRVLDVSSNKDGMIFLYEECGELAPYITLSHCWGRISMMKTTKANYNQRRAGMRLSQFPATFQDTIQIARALHIQYVWIDSLCIFQDDQLDWEEQSALMATIYSNCYLNLAATHSPNSNGGLFLERWIPSFDAELGSERHSITSHPVLFQGAANIFVRRSFVNAHIDMLISDGGDRLYSVDESAPLVTRAWAYQERLLSPRAINFHSAELTWDCGGSGGFCFDCECGHLKTQSFALEDFNVLDKERFVGESASAVTKEEALITWLDIVVHFSKLRLTFTQDRLPAIAGIAKRAANIIQSGYLAGLWEADIARGLVWRADYAPEEGHYLENIADVGTRADPYRAPTWSWASIALNADRACSKWISYQFAYDTATVGAFCVDGRFKVLGYECDTAGANVYGCVTGGHLFVKGAVIVMTFTYDRFYDMAEHGDGSYYFDFNIFEKGHAYIPEGDNIIVLLVGGQGQNCIAILLVAAKKELGKYERVGIAGMEEKDFKLAEEMVIDIV